MDRLKVVELPGPDLRAQITDVFKNLAVFEGIVRESEVHLNSGS